MPKLLKRSNQLTETVSFRLTLDERRTLDRLIKRAGVTLTEFLRSLIREKAAGLPRIGRPIKGGES